MRILLFILTLPVAGLVTQQHASISADEVTLRHNNGSTNDRILVAVSGYAFREDIPGIAVAVQTRKSGATSSS